MELTQEKEVCCGQESQTEEPSNHLRTPGMECHDLEFAFLGCGLALVQYFHTSLPSSPYEMVMHIQSHFVFKVRDLLWILIL